MKVSLNPINTNNYYFKANQTSPVKNEAVSQNTPSKNDITTAKIKKALSEVKYVLLGVIIIYFAMKRNFKFNRIANMKNIEMNKAEMDIPKVDKSIFNGLY